MRANRLGWTLCVLGVLPLLTGCFRFTTVKDDTTRCDLLESPGKPLDPTVRLRVSAAVCTREAMLSVAANERGGTYTVDVSQRLIRELRALGYENVGDSNLSDPDYSVDLAIYIKDVGSPPVDHEVSGEILWNTFSIVCLVACIPPWPLFFTVYGDTELDVWGKEGTLECSVLTKADTVCLSVWNGFFIRDHWRRRHVRAAAHMLVDWLNTQQRQRLAPRGP